MFWDRGLDLKGRKEFRNIKGKTWDYRQHLSLAMSFVVIQSGWLLFRHWCPSLTGDNRYLCRPLAPVDIAICFGDNLGVSNNPDLYLSRKDGPLRPVAAREHPLRERFTVHLDRELVGVMKK